MPKPYDRLFKTLAEDDPRGLLHLFGSVPLELPAEVEPVEREIAPPLLAVDHVYRVRTTDREWMVHYEAQTRYQADLPERMAWYGVALALRFRLPIEMALVLLVERHAPAAPPSGFHVDLGAVRFDARYRVVRLWELDAGGVLETGRPALLPWIPLMRANLALVEAAAAEIVRRGDRKLAAEFVVLGGLRYDREGLAELLARLRGMLTQEMLEESSYYQMVLEKGMEKGIEKGIQKGIQKGTVAEAQKNLRLILGVRFPGLETIAEIDLIQDARQLEQLLVEAVTASDRDRLAAAIRSAAGQS